VVTVKAAKMPYMESLYFRGPTHGIGKSFYVLACTCALPFWDGEIVAATPTTKKTASASIIGSQQDYKT